MGSKEEYGALGTDLLAKVTEVGVEIPDSLQDIILKSKENHDRRSANQEEEEQRITAKADTVMTLEDDVAKHTRKIKRIKRRIRNLQPSEIELPENLRKQIEKIDADLETAEGVARGELVNEKKAVLASDNFRLCVYKAREEINREIEGLQGLIKVCGVARDQLMSDPVVADKVRRRKAMAVLGGMPERRSRLNSRLQLVHKSLDTVSDDLVKARDQDEITELLGHQAELKKRKESLDNENQELLSEERICKMIVDGCPTCILCERTRPVKQMVMSKVARLWNKDGGVVTTRLSREIVDLKQFKREDLETFVCKYHLEQVFVNALEHRGVKVLCAACGGTPGEGKCNYSNNNGKDFPSIMFRRPNTGEEIDLQKPFDPEREVLVCPKQNARLKREEGLKCCDETCGKSFDYLYSIDVEPDGRGMYPRIEKGDPGAKETKGLCRNCLRRFKNERNHNRRGGRRR